MEETEEKETESFTDVVAEFEFASLARAEAHAFLDEQTQKLDEFRARAEELVAQAADACRDADSRYEESRKKLMRVRDGVPPSRKRALKKKKKWKMKRLFPAK